MSESFPVVPSHSHQSFPRVESFPPYRGNSLTRNESNESFPKTQPGMTQRSPGDGGGAESSRAPKGKREATGRSLPCSRLGLFGNR